MSFFADSPDLTIVAKIDGLTGTNSLNDPAFENALGIGLVDFSFRLFADPQQFNDGTLIDTKSTVDYIPMLALTVGGADGASQQELFQAVEDNAIYNSMELIAVQSDGKVSVVRVFGTNGGLD